MLLPFFFSGDKEGYLDVRDAESSRLQFGTSSRHGHGRGDEAQLDAIRSSYEDLASSVLLSQTVVKAQAGSDAVLPCRLRADAGSENGDGAVSRTLLLFVRKVDDIISAMKHIPSLTFYLFIFF